MIIVFGEEKSKFVGGSFFFWTHLPKILCISHFDGFGSIKQSAYVFIDIMYVVGSSDLPEHALRTGSDSKIRVVELRR